MISVAPWVVVEAFAPAYIAIGAIIGTLFWSRTRRRAGVPPTRGYEGRRVFLTITIGFLWPGFLVLALIYLFPSGRSLINALIGLPADAGRPEDG